MILLTPLVIHRGKVKILAALGYIRGDADVQRAIWC